MLECIYGRDHLQNLSGLCLPELVIFKFGFWGQWCLVYGVLWGDYAFLNTDNSVSQDNL